MLYFGSTYLIVKDFNKSIEFYEKLFESKPTAKNYNRWAQFDCNGHCVALYSEDYDRKIIDSGENLDKHYNKEYIEWFNKRKIFYGNNFVLNLGVKNLNDEYKRLKKLNIGQMSEILYVNIACPYYFFTVDDPDGNTIEIAGEYNEY